METVPAALVMRLRRATDAPVMICKRLLAAVPAGEREAMVRDVEEGRRLIGCVYTVEDSRLLRGIGENNPP